MSPRPDKTPSIRDQLAKLETHIQQRMEELEPLAREYHELEQIARRLGLVGAGTSRSNGRAPAGHRHEQMLSLIRDQPGITVREAATELDVDPTSLYRIVRRLVDDGDIEKRGLQLHPR